MPAVTDHHSLLHESFADDTQLQTSGQMSDLHQMIATTQDCVSDLKYWMIRNKLQLNGDKTEVLLAIPSELKNHPSLPCSSYIKGTDIASSPLVRSLGVTVDPTLTFRKHISNSCKTACFELRRISSLRHYLSVVATKTLVCSFVLSRLDSCNPLIAGPPK